MNKSKFWGLSFASALRLMGAFGCCLYCALCPQVLRGGTPSTENICCVTLTIAEYNVENLFDAQHDSLKNDHDFLPDGRYYWSQSRYWQKLNAVARAIMSIGTSGDDYTPVDIIGLCEVENDSTLIALTQRSLLRGANYRYLMTNSPDKRGIDVALLYSPYSFKPVSSYSIRIDTLGGMRPTRDILYVKGELNNGDSLHVFVVHTPSRLGGEAKSSPFRVKVTSRICLSVDSINAKEKDAKVVVMGDFNDYGDVPSLKLMTTHNLTDISLNAKGRNGAEATYRYKGEWNSLDHIFVSEALLKCVSDCHVADDKMLLEPDTKYAGVKPRRFMIFNKLNDGFSDHLPLKATLQFTDR